MLCQMGNMQNWFEKDMVGQYSFGEEVPVGIYEGFYIKVGI